MIAKLITHDTTRAGAVAMMRRALDQFVVRGVATNIAFQAALLRHERFVAGDFHTGFMAEEYPDGFNAADMPHADRRCSWRSPRSCTARASTDRPRSAASSRATSSRSPRNGPSFSMGSSAR